MRASILVLFTLWALPESGQAAAPPVEPLSPAKRWEAIHAKFLRQEDRLCETQKRYEECKVRYEYEIDIAQQKQEELTEALRQTEENLRSAREERTGARRQALLVLAALAVALGMLGFCARKAFRR